MGTSLTTKPMIYEGDELELNFKGEVKVTVTNQDGVSVTSEWIKGDEIAKIIEFDGDLPEGEVTLNFEMKEGTKLYSFKFNK